MNSSQIGVGIDISAYKLDVAILNDTELLQTFCIAKNSAGFLKLLNTLDSLPATPHIVFEATGVYSVSVATFFNQNGYDFDCINPLMARQLNARLRQNKTDRVDAIKLAEIATSRNYAVTSIKTDVYENLKVYDQWYENDNKDIVSAKNRVHRALQQVFPFIKFPVNNELPLYYELFHEFPHAALVRDLTTEQITAQLYDALHDAHPLTHWTKYAKILQQTAAESVPGLSRNSPEVMRLRQLTQRVLELMADKDSLVTQMTQLAEPLPEYRLYCSIPGISAISACQLMAEIGDIRRFQRASQVNAYVGIDLRHYESGKFVGTDTISKRGNAIARKVLYRIVQQIYRTCQNSNHFCHIADYYQKKKQSFARKTAEKMTKKFTIACIHRLIRTLIGLVKHGEMYDYNKAIMRSNI